jgi:hypothetical protein
MTKDVGRFSFLVDNERLNVSVMKMLPTISLVYIPKKYKSH